MDFDEAIAYLRQIDRLIAPRTTTQLEQAINAIEEHDEEQRQEIKDLERSLEIAQSK